MHTDLAYIRAERIVMSFSQDCMQWSLLPYADQGLKSKSSLLQGRFTGDPAFEYEHTVTHRVGEGEAAQEQTTAVSEALCLLK